MSFLIRWTATRSDGEVLHDETTVAEIPAVEAIEKRVWVLGSEVTLRVSFDPPLVPRELPEREDVQANIGTAA